MFFKQNNMFETDDLLKKRQYKRKVQVADSVKKRINSLAKKSSDLSLDSNSNDIALRSYVMAIASKLAILGGYKESYEKEISSFKEIFLTSQEEQIFRIFNHEKIAKIFKDAVLDNVEASHYAKQIMNIISENKILLEKIIDNLFIFSDADSSINSKKILLLKEVTLIFGFNINFFKRMMRHHFLPEEKSPFHLLNAPKNITYVELKKIYRKAVSQCHPDKFIGLNICDDLLDIYKEQFNNYNKAYDAIKIKRGFSN